MRQEGNKSRFTGLIILSCCFVFLVSISMTKSMVIDFVNRFGLIPLTFMAGINYFSAIAYMFIHIDLTHLVTNMFALYSVGITLERNIGTTNFSIIFLLSGIFSGFFHSTFNPDSTIPVVGASGAIFGIIAVLFLFMPFTLTTALIVPVPGVVLGLFLLTVETMALISKESVGIAHDIHLYGFIIGSLCAFVIDYDRALRGLIIAVVVLLVIYIIGFQIQGISI